ncbi:MAG TPA: helicase, partial [Desulfotomaculum sp.]|nr:helicase [Desulfotomaculum sp.]
MNTDLSFITNEQNQSLKDRFEVLIKDTSFFDCLVGYFYASGFHALYKSLEKTEKIRILIGISTNRQTYDLLDKASKPGQQVIEFSHAETKEEVEKLIEQELADSEDNRKVEEGVNKFIEWVRDRKLEIRAYPSQNIHAKLYIMTFYQGDRDVGRVITGSSNFTRAGLIDNLEFNVELKNRSDYEFSRQKFDELWKDAVDVSERYVQTIQEKTWLSQNITPYQLYLKFIYEYFKDELSQTDEVFVKYLPPEFKKLEYQEQAVFKAKKKLLGDGGGFFLGVVGGGETLNFPLAAGEGLGGRMGLAPPGALGKTQTRARRN